MSQADFHATVFVCQGSPDPAWREPYDRLVDGYRLTDPDARIQLAFCEAMAPGLTEVIDELAIDLCDRIRVITLDLAPGGAGDRTLDAALRAAARRWPEMHFVRLAGEAVDAPRPLCVDSMGTTPSGPVRCRAD